MNNARKIFNFIKKIYYASMKRLGSNSLKKKIWDKEFDSGKWDYLENTNNDIIYYYLEKYANNGHILDLGCGLGNTGNEIDIYKYKHYTGIDISESAIHKSRLKLSKERTGKNEYFASDILKYVPDRKYDIILFRESIYYFLPTAVLGILERYKKYLRNNGVFIVRIHDRIKHSKIVRIIENNHNLIEKNSLAGSETVVIVFN